MDNPEELKENSKRGVVFLRVAKIAIYFLIFLLPLFFLPWTSNVLEFNKQALLFFLVLISLISWLAHILISYRLEISKSFLNLPVLLLVLVTAISTLFSLFRYGSFWGHPLVISSSFLSLLAFVALYFIIANLFKREEIPLLFLTLFLSGFLVALLFLFQFFGKFIFPFDFARQTSFNTIGTINSLAIFFSLLLILLLPLFFLVRGFFKIILGISGLTFFFCLFLINFLAAWIVFTSGLAVLFTLAVVSLRKTKNKSQPGFIITFLMFFLIIGLFFTFFRFSLPGLPSPPLEISPGQKDSLEIFKQLPLKSLIFGSGPGTFLYDWTKYKSVKINQTIFWPVRFSQASSEVLDRAITSGILGILAFFFLLIVCGKSLLNFLLERGKSEMSLDPFLLWAILAGLFSLVVAFFWYPANLSILFVFWLLVAFLSLLDSEPKKVWDLEVSPLRALIVSFFSVLILLSGLGLSILYIQRYLAEVRYFQGLQAWQRGEAEQSSNFILRATNLNPRLDLYWRDLSQISLFRLQALLQRTDLSQEELTTQAQSLIVSAVNSASQATLVNPNNVANWNIRGFVYRNLIGIAAGADDWALTSYEKAKTLEPASPYILTEIGRVYLLKSDLLAKQKKEQEKIEALAKAKENFEKAIELKSDYAPAHFLIAMIYVRENKIAQAIEKLEDTKVIAPFDAGLAFQLGLIYYNDNQFEKAKGELERAVLIDPNYSNARYFLGLIYDREGKKKEAISQFEKIEELNPDNEEVKKILANLREGKPALEGIVPGQPPIEEKPAEQLEK